MTAVGIHPNVDVRELGQQIGKAGEKPTVRERRRHLNSDDFQSGALLAAQPDIARGSAQPAYALSYGAGIFGPVRGERHAPTNPVEKRSEEHTSDLQSLMRSSYAVFCLKKKKNNKLNYSTQYIK